MKLLQIGSSYSEDRPGGISTFVEGLVGALRDAGTRTVGLVASEGALEERSGGALRQGGALHDVRPKRYLDFRRRALEEGLGNGTMVAGHYIPHVVAMLDVLRRHPFVFHFHGPAELEQRFRGASEPYCQAVGAYERYLYRRAAAITTLSEAYRDVLVDHYGVDPMKVRVLPPGIDLSAVPPPSQSDDVPRDPGVLRIVTVRRLVPRTGVDLLLHAVGELNKEGVPVECVVVGEGPEEGRLRSMVDALGLQESVRLLGKLSDQEVSARHRWADVSVVPSRALEGFGLVILEALAHGTPVIGTRIGGIPEVLGSLSDRLVVDETTPEALATRLSEFYRSPDCFPDPSACRAHVEAGYEWGEVVIGYLELYRSVL